MNFNLNTWIGQVTTGHGAMILGPTLLALGAGNITWQTAAPFLTAGIIGLLWPENVPMQSAGRSMAQDVETLIAAYRTGVSHGAAGDAPEQANPAKTPQPQVHNAGSLAALAVLAAAGLALSACAGQTPAQQASTGTAVAAGLVCLADASGKVIATADTGDSDEMQAVNAAIAAGAVLLSDAACQTALASATAAVPHIASVSH